jgi:hypothetical protein
MFTSWPAAVVRPLTTHQSTFSNLFDNVSIMARAEVAKFSTAIVKRVIAFGRVMHATFLLQLRFVRTHGFSISLMVFGAGFKQRGTSRATCTFGFVAHVCFEFIMPIITFELATLSAHT